MIGAATSDDDEVLTSFIASQILTDTSEAHWIRAGSFGLHRSRRIDL